MQDIFKSILRILQLLWLVILTGLIGNVIALNINAAGNATAAINFSMFVIVLAWLAALYGLIANYVETIAIPVAMLALDAAATLFTFIAAVVLAAKLRATNCGGDLNPDILGGDWIGFGSADNQKRCRSIQAGTTFMWFLFACFVGTLFFVAAGWRRGGGGSIRSGAPHMSQLRV